MDDDDGSFGPIGRLPPVSTIQANINSRYDELYYVDGNGERVPFVCLVCDEFIMHRDDLVWFPLKDLKKCEDVLHWDAVLSDDERIPYLEEQFKFNDRENAIKNPEWLNRMGLSPRGIVKCAVNPKASGVFSCCKACATSLRGKRTPHFAIVNRNHIGCAPPCLSELTEVELALITPVKGYGYCFTFKGGAQKKLEGTMTFMRVEERRIARAIMQLEGMGLCKNVVVLLNGDMTPQQHTRAASKVRTDKVIDAVEWLCKNHKRWKGINLNAFREELENNVPVVVVDKSSEVASENTNIEETQLFRCFYPDGAINENAGGFDDNEAFREYVKKMQEQQYNVELQIDLAKEFCRGSDGDQLVNACLLQFPFGIGGLEETRYDAKGVLQCKAETEGFLLHLSKLSQPTFQTPMFQLIMYSLSTKLKLLNRSRLQLRGQHSASTLVNGLDADDLARLIRNRGRGSSEGTKASKTLLDAVDACSRALPHTNAAAKTARHTAESMQQHFGMGTFFGTLTCDDENSFLLQVLSGSIIDPPGDVNDLTDDELMKRVKKRKALRIQFPGLCAINFEMLFHIFVEEVIGWDCRNNKATWKAGLFGFCKALAAAFEEQGRASVVSYLNVVCSNECRTDFKLTCCFYVACAFDRMDPRIPASATRYLLFKPGKNP